MIPIWVRYEWAVWASLSRSRHRRELRRSRIQHSKARLRVFGVLACLGAFPALEAVTYDGTNMLLQLARVTAAVCLIVPFVYAVLYRP